MHQACIVTVQTDSGLRQRLQVRLLDGRSVNLRVHACDTCSFVGWGPSDGVFFVDVELSDDFVAQLTSVVLAGKTDAFQDLSQRVFVHSR